MITSSDENAGTLGQVTLTIFGTDGDSGPLPLGEPASGLFEREDADQFDVCKALGCSLMEFCQ